MQAIGKAQLLSEGILIQTGSPHVLIEVGELDFASSDFERQAAQLRYSAEFRAQGVNVNWVLNAGEEIRLRTYERGVERETLSCGTAAVAAAVWWKEHKSGSVGNRVSIQTRGGTLTVFWDKENQVWLRGTVHFTFQGVWQGFGM
jgi:diaminopimelate epimerase